MSNSKAILVFLTFVYNLGYAQSFTLEGKINSNDGKVLPGAHVHLHELDLTVSSNSEGYFKIENLKSGTYHLHVNFVGFEAMSRDIKISSDEFIDVQLNEAYKELDEVIVESSFMNSEESESSLNIQNVNKESITRAGAGSFVNALEEIPGISAINTGVGVAKPMIRGMSFNRVMVNDNGIKQEGQQWGSDHGLEIDQFNVSRVEIVKGPATLMYGSDALGGAINILPDKIPSESEINAEIRGLYRSNNQTIGSTYMLEGAKNDWYARARFSMLDFGDYQVPANSFTYNNFTLDIENERLKNTAGRERNAAMTIGLRKKWGNANVTYTRFDQKAGLFAGAIGIPRAYDLQDDGDLRDINLPYQKTIHEKIVFNSLVHIGKSWLETQVGYQNNMRQERTIPHAHGVGPVPEGSLALNLGLQTFTLNTRLRKRINEKTKDVYGISGQYQMNSASGYEHLLSPYASLQMGVYSMRQHQLNPSIVLSGGARFDYGQIEISEYMSPVWVNAENIDYFSQRNPEIQKTFYNYSASFGMSWFPIPELNVKTNIGKSFRIPSAAELSINGVHHGTFRHELGNNDLVSEDGYQFDLGIIFNKRKLQISLSPYFNLFQNYIYLSPSGSFGYTDQRGNLVLLPEAGQTFKYKQNNALISGFEFLADYHFVSHWHVELGAEYVYKYNLETRLPLPFTPPPSIHTAMDYEWEYKTLTFGLGAQYKHVFDQNNVDRNELRTPGFDLLNMSARVQGKIMKQDISLYFKVRNALDTRYLNHLSRYRLLNLPEQGRDFVISLILNI